MANRNFSEKQLSLEKAVVHLYAHITFGASGAPTLDTANSKGVVSVTKGTTGLYTLQLGTNAASLDKYTKLLMIKHAFDATGNSGTAPAAPGMFLTANAVATAGTLQVEFNAAGTATNPASTEGVFLEIILGNTSAI